MEDITIARVAHEINQAYCQALGDTSQLPWDDAPKWQQETVLAGVNYHINHPNATPQDSHESWLTHKLADGWRYGMIKDATLKLHPCMVPFSQLPVAQKAKDYIFKAVVWALVDF